MDTYYPPDDVIEAWAKTCCCCPQCWTVPCDACCAGGVCNAFDCQCDAAHIWDDGHVYGDDEDDQ
jgi:hypothetical protein